MEITKEVSRSDLLIVKRIREFWQEKVNQEYPMGSFDEFLIKSVTDHVFRKDFGGGFTELDFGRTLRIVDLWWKNANNAKSESKSVSEQQSKSKPIVNKRERIKWKKRAKFNKTPIVFSEIEEIQFNKSVA